MCYSLAFCSGAASEAAGLRLTADKREAAGSTTKWSTHQLEDSLPHHGQALAYAGGTRCSRASHPTGPRPVCLVLGRALSGSAPGPGTRQVSLRPQPLAGCPVGACGEDECPPRPSLGWVGARAEGCPTSPWVQDVFRLSGRGSPWARPACRLPAD